MDKRDYKTAMNKVFLTILGVLLLVSCNSGGPKNESSKSDEVSAPVQPAKKVRKPLSFSGTFYQITCIGSPNVVFTEGDYSIEAEAPENILNAIHVDVDCNVLTLSIDREDAIGINQFSSDNAVTLYVSCPSLQLLATCGTGNFKSIGTIHNTDMHVGCLGTGSIELDTVMTSGTFKYESSGDGNAVFHHIRADHDCSMLLSGAGSTTADVDIAEKLLVQNDYTGDVSVSGKANIADVMIMEQSNCVVAFDANQLNLTALKGNVALKGKYKQKEVNQGKNARVSL